MKPHIILERGFWCAYAHRHAWRPFAMSRSFASLVRRLKERAAEREARRAKRAADRADRRARANAGY